MTTEEKIDLLFNALISKPKTSEMKRQERIDLCTANANKNKLRRLAKNKA